VSALTPRAHFSIPIGDRHEPHISYFDFRDVAGTRSNRYRYRYRIGVEQPSADTVNQLSLILKYYR
jgi:hypothetical protein